MAIRIMLDSNVYDRIVETPDFRERLCSAIEESKVDIISTHVQRDELQEIPDKEKRSAVLSVPDRSIPTYGVVLGVSRLGEARFGDDPHPMLETVKGGNPRHAEDALIAATAEKEADVLVSDDGPMVRRMRRYLKTHNSTLEIWSFDEFKKGIDLLVTNEDKFKES